MSEIETLAKVRAKNSTDYFPCTFSNSIQNGAGDCAEGSRCGLHRESIFYKTAYIIITIILLEIVLANCNVMLICIQRVPVVATAPQLARSQPSDDVELKKHIQNELKAAIFLLAYC